MLNFGLPLLLNWRPLRKTSYLKIKGLCGMVIYNLQKRSWKVAKTTQHGGNQERIRPPPAKGTTAATRPGERDNFRPGTVFDLYRGRKNIR